MAWRPYENLVQGELDNTILGKVTGWMVFLRRGDIPLKVSFYLEGDFHEDIRGKKIKLTNANPKYKDEGLNENVTYMDGFSEIQTGGVGDITAGIPVDGVVPYVDYPYIEWYSEENGRVVLELDHDQVEIIEETSSHVAPLKEREKREQAKKRQDLLFEFLQMLAKELST